MKKIMTYEVRKEQDGCCLKQILAKNMDLSRHEISRLKFQSGLFLNDLPAKTNAAVHVGDRVRAVFSEKERTGAAGCHPVTILYEDNDVLVVHKPADMPVHAVHGHLEDSLGTALQAHMEQREEAFTVRSVGRLDQSVSGCVVFAKNRPAAARLNQQMKDGVLQKTYIAFCRGVISSAVTYREPILRLEGKRKRMAAENGLPALTHVMPVARYRYGREDITMIEVRIETGRTHQIRVHLSFHGHPLLGDSLYGEADQNIGQTALHCSKVRLISPFDKKQITVTDPLPECLEQLKKDGC